MSFAESFNFSLLLYLGRLEGHVGFGTIIIISYNFFLLFRTVLIHLSLVLFWVISEFGIPFLCLNTFVQ